MNTFRGCYSGRLHSCGSGAAFLTPTLLVELFINSPRQGFERYSLKIRIIDITSSNFAIFIDSIHNGIADFLFEPSSGEVVERVDGGPFLHLVVRLRLFDHRIEKELVAVGKGRSEPIVQDFDDLREFERPRGSASRLPASVGPNTAPPAPGASSMVPSLIFCSL